MKFSDLLKCINHFTPKKIITETQNRIINMASFRSSARYKVKNVVLKWFHQI